MPDASSFALADQLKSLTDAPGVYRFFDAEGNLLYVGKAKNLKKRVNSYFQKEHDSARLRVLVRKTSRIETLVTETEWDALLLENNLIKALQPRYNILLRDDKTYPWICIKKEPFPRIFSTRKQLKDGSEYLGPFASVKSMRAVLDLIRSIYPLRSCKLNLSAENIAARKFKVCLEYHLNNCLGPCVGEQSEAEYMEMVAEARAIVRGKTGSLIRELKQQMNECAAQYRFEEAQHIKLKLESIEQFRAKSVVVQMGMEHLDVFAYARDSEEIYVHYLQISEGAVVQGFTLELQPGLEESDGELLRMAMLELRLRFDSEAPQAVVPFLPEEEFKGLELIVPQRGEKKALLDLAERNIRFYRKEKLSQMSVKDPERHTQRILETLQRDLRLKELPVHMECFDNSNFQGAFPVSAMVCFKHAKPSKADYRHYNVKTVEGPDDFSTMKEVISRRYRACVEQPETLPQLIVIDGGKGQLNAALQALSELGLQHKVAIIGIAKRLEEIYFPNDSVPMYLDKRSESLKVIQQMRNEAHRFGIAHYRQRHRASLKKSELENIAGIGKKRAQDLLKAFKSVRRIREASEEELKGVVGAEVARGIVDYFSPEALNLSGENHGESGNN